MLVSFLMSTYNEPLTWIVEAVESMMNQTHSDLEIIIIVDNPKNAKMVQLLEKYAMRDSRIKLIINEKNIGLVKTLNKGIEISNGDFIARMDADDICMPDRIEKQLSYMLKNNVDLLGGGRDVISESGEVVEYFSKSGLSQEKIMELLKYRSIIYHPTWLIRKSVYMHLNKYRNVQAAEDYDFVLRALMKDYKIDILDEKVLQYRTRDDSISNLNGLRQLLTSYYLRKEFKHKQILSVEELNSKLDIRLTEKNMKKYNKGLFFLREALKNLKQKNMIIMSINLIKSVFSSKYVLLYLQNTSKFKMEYNKTQ